MIKTIPEVAEILRQGGVCAFPTETVYGLGAHPFHPEAIERIYAIKGRAADHPLSLHISQLGELFKFGQDIPSIANRFINWFWPGPLALIVPSSPLVPPRARSNRQTASFRYPNHLQFRELGRLVGVPLLATSANRSGSLSAVSSLDVEEEIGEWIDGTVDGGTSDYALESTLVDLTTDPPTVLREGAIGIELLQERTSIRLGKTGRKLVRLEVIILPEGKSLSQEKLDNTVVLKSVPKKASLFFSLLADLQKRNISRVYIPEECSLQNTVVQRLWFRSQYKKG
jgi:tRNA threonylcarbamoyl adenosine modification protein (Sua5/YciO/YrdC/YwlC family)